MEFRLLGPLEVEEDGRVLPLGGAKPRALLAVLLLDANRVVSRDRLLAALWPDRPPESGAKALHVYVSQLRKALEPERPPGASNRILVTSAPGYLVRVRPDQLDLHRFERLLAEGRQALTDGQPQQAADTLRSALALWRGAPLGEFASESFARVEIMRLQDLGLAALEERIEADLALGRHHDLVGELEALLAQEPLRERLRAQHMLALYRSGRQAEALAAYQEIRRLLVDELGIEPGRALQELERAVLLQDPSLDLSPLRVEARSAPPAEPLPSPSPPVLPPGQERKLATVLFADLVGSTEIGEDDPERTRALLERFYEAMAGEVGAAGGTVEKFVGDAVMAAFGAPAAREDHAERALHAALAMRMRLEELFGGTLALRIGVNTGEVVVGSAREGGSFASGDPVNVAARLEQAAAPGEILAGDRTAAAAGGAFEFSERVVLEVRGKPGGVGARRLVRALRLGRPRGVSGLHRAFVGREVELELLQAAYHRVVGEAAAHLVTIMGEAGVGKSSLVELLWERIASESPAPLRRSGRCLPYGRGITFHPLGEILKEQLGLLDSDPPETVRQRLGGREILGLTLGLDAAPDVHPVVARERLHEAWVELLEELAAEQPVLVLIEDLHWAEEPLLELLERLLQDVQAPVLLVATARPELLDRRPAWAGGRRNTATVWLEPLSAGESQRLLGELLETELPEGLRALVIERAEGNPFFVEELLATLIDQAVLEREEGSWVVRDHELELVIPDSVQAVLAARIDLLAPAEKSALQAAAVIGRAFWAGAVAGLLGGAEPDVRALEERDFIRRRPVSSMAGEREYTFKHALTREVAYATLPKARRARLHAAFADWLERVGEARDEHAALLAHHYAESVRPEDADLAWPGEEEELERLREKALAWLRRAAELAAARYALDEEIALLERAVALEQTRAERLELWQAIARANTLKFDREAFERAILRAVEECDDPEQRAELFSELAFEVVYRWRHDEDRELTDAWIDRALELAGPQSAARARALIARSFLGMSDADELAWLASELAERLPDRKLRAHAFHARAYGALAAADYSQARHWAERRLELLGALGDPDLLADGFWSAVPAYAGEGLFADARRVAALHDEVTSQLTPHHRLHGIAVLLEVEELAGDWERVRELTPRAEHAVEENAALPCVHNPRSLLVCALAAAYLGDDAEARRLETLTASLGVGEHGRSVDVRVRLALLGGDLDGARAMLAELARPAVLRTVKLMPVAVRLDALAALGERERVETEAPPLLRPGTYLEPFALRALGAVREDEGLVEQAAAGFEAMGAGWYAEQTRALAARPRPGPHSGVR